MKVTLGRGAFKRGQEREIQNGEKRLDGRLKDRQVIVIRRRRTVVC